MPLFDFDPMYAPVCEYTLFDVDWALREAVQHITKRICWVLPARNEASTKLQHIRLAPWWDLTPFEWIGLIRWRVQYNRLDPLLRYLQALLSACREAQSSTDKKFPARAFRYLAPYYNHLAREYSAGGLLIRSPDIIIWDYYLRAKALANLFKSNDDEKDLLINPPEALSFRVWDFPKPSQWWNLAGWIRHFPGLNFYVVFVEAIFGLYGSPYRMLPMMLHGLLTLWSYRSILR